MKNLLKCFSLFQCFLSLINHSLLTCSFKKYISLDKKKKNREPFRKKKLLIFLDLLKKRKKKKKKVKKEKQKNWVKMGSFWKKKKKKAKGLVIKRIAKTNPPGKKSFTSTQRL